MRLGICCEISFTPELREKLRTRSCVVLNRGAYAYWDNTKTPPRVDLFGVSITIWLAHYCGEVLNTIRDSRDLALNPSFVFMIGDCVVLNRRVYTLFVQYENPT